MSTFFFVYGVLGLFFGLVTFFEQLFMKRLKDEGRVEPFIQNEAEAVLKRPWWFIGLSIALWPIVVFNIVRGFLHGREERRRRQVR